MPAIQASVFHELVYEMRQLKKVVSRPVSGLAYMGLSCVRCGRVSETEMCSHTDCAAQASTLRGDAL
jgi:hypothetical protein